MTTPEIKATAVQAITALNLSLTGEQAHDLYNEVYALLRDLLDVSTVRDRSKRDMPVLYALYDALHAAGIDGTRGSS